MANIYEPTADVLSDALFEAARAMGGSGTGRIWVSTSMGREPSAALLMVNIPLAFIERFEAALARHGVSAYEWVREIGASEADRHEP